MPTLSTNKKAKHEYQLLETLEAGIMLAGHEVKAVRNGQAKLLGAYVTFHNNEAFLTNAHISQYKQASQLTDYQPDKSRKLLLKTKEIAYLQAKSQEKGLTIVPISLYTKRARIKVEIAVARGKKAFDKRESVKKRELDRETRRALKR